LVGDAAGKKPGEFVDDLLDLLDFVQNEEKCFIPRYIILDTIQVSGSIYHSKISEEDYDSKINDRLVKVY